MAERALGAGEHGVVVGQHGARAALVAEQVAVDACRARDEPVGGGARDQVGQIAAKSLGGDREPSVLDERARVDEILDVLARGASVACVPAFDRIGARRVLGERATPQQFGVIVADGLRPSGSASLMASDANASEVIHRGSLVSSVLSAIRLTVRS